MTANAPGSQRLKMLQRKIRDDEMNVPVSMSGAIVVADPSLALAELPLLLLMLRWLSLGQSATHSCSICKSNQPGPT